MIYMGLILSQDLTYDVVHILALCICKKYVHMFVKNVEGNGKMKNLQVTMKSIKSWDLKDLGLGSQGI
jgi:hypothetical protein